ncbi:MAG: GntR family transcriptional regulator [Rhodobacter sp.]|nr:GntR family transcriptional regulator [Paracoccaceae bacterium]MCC0078157.1 GntR family transcriptional regulator [Rhodobacter sp.]
MKHSELAALLTEEIQSGRFEVGSKFPTEMELQERFKVGRHTVREALKVMTEQGLVGRRRRSGTTVLSSRPYAQYVHVLRDINTLFDFAQDTVLNISRIEPVTIGAGGNDAMPELPEGRYTQVSGLRCKAADGQPLCWSRVTIPERFAPSEHEIIGGGRAIYELVIRHNQLKLDSVEQEVSAIELPADLAENLSARDQVAALLIRRKYLTPTGEAFEYSSNIYPADRFTQRTLIAQKA